MNWDAIAAVAELVAALGVIVSLIYLASQVRQNTQSVRAATTYQLADVSARVNLGIASDPNTAQTFFAGLANPEDLDERQRAQFTLLLHLTLRLYENAYFQHREGTLDPRIWQSWKASAHRVLSSRGARAVWSRDEYTSGYHDDFRHFIEDILRTDQEGAGLRPLDADPKQSG